ncbi:MAG: metal ABC transporter ATP-binding protein [Gammaproteobacteria bacterium]
MTAAVQLDGVTFDYGGPPVLVDVTLEIRAGEFFGLIGPNGGGKSTLLKIILGLLEPSSGSVRVCGLPPREGRVRIGYCPQYISFPRGFPITVEEVVMLGRLGISRRPGGFGAGDRREAARALQATDTVRLAARTVGELSGGELQRVLIARALAAAPEILVLDESTANVDHHAGIEIFDLLKRLSERLTIIVVSHDIGFISPYVTRVGCLNRSLECHPIDALDSHVLDRLYESHAVPINHARGGP